MCANTLLRIACKRVRNVGEELDSSPVRLDYSAAMQKPKRSDASIALKNSRQSREKVRLKPTRHDQHKWAIDLLSRADPAL